MKPHTPYVKIMGFNQTYFSSKVNNNNNTDTRCYSLDSVRDIL